jgi:hypothetical protein
MSNVVKVFLIIAAVLVVTGGAIACVGFAQGGMNAIAIFDKRLNVINEETLSDVDVVNGVYPDTRNITIDVGIVSVVRVVRGEELTVKASNPKLFGSVSARAEGDTLYITSESRKWSIFSFGYGIGNMFCDKGYIEITVPEGITLNKVKITADFPAVTVSDLNAVELDVDCDMGGVKIQRTEASRLTASASMGAVKIESSKSNDLTVTADMGSLEMRDVSAVFTKAKLSMGGANFVGFESGGLDLDCDMGGVEITGILKGASKISCSVGGIELKLNQPEDSLSLDIAADVGAVYVNGVKVSGGGGLQIANTGAPNPEGILKATADMGSISIDFSS